MKQLLVTALLGALATFVPLAHADAALFGEQDSIRFVADTTIQTPGGRLYLGHRVTTHAFLLPFAVEDRGLVFGVSGDPGRFVPIPPAEELAGLQAAGLLPRDLPRPQLGWTDYLVGYSLELVIVAVLAFFLAWKKMASRRRR
jgi:hypothetical protein